MVEVRQTERFARWLDALRDVRGRAVIILLAGGSKHTQTADIRASLRLARGLSE